MALATTSRCPTSERLVSGIWKAQIFDRERLVTDCGQVLQIVYPGRPRSDHGPDFRDAIIAFDNELRRGDVEVHRLAGDWQAHGHHRDPHYTGVILHVVFDANAGSIVRRADDQAVPTLEVRPLLALSLSQIEEYLASHQDSSPCVKAASLDAAATRGILERAGEERFLSKAAGIEGSLCIGAPAQVLYELLLESLGYSKNKLPFRALADVVPFDLLENVTVATVPGSRREVLQALLLGAAGLLPSQRLTGADRVAAKDPYVRRLEDCWAELADYLGGRRVTHPWRFSRVRPENFPTRRIVAAAELLTSRVAEGLVESFVETFREHPPEVAVRLLVRGLRVRASDAYWRRRFDFSDREVGRESLLIGSERAAVMAVNAVLPFILALGWHLSDDALCWQAMECYRRFPSLPGNELSRYVADLLGRQSVMVLPASARVQQGLLHIYHKWCREKDCAGCLIGQ